MAADPDRDQVYVVDLAKRAVTSTIQLSPGDEPGRVVADLVVFPDEPYAFAPGDGPEAWPQCRPVFVSGRHLTWYGPSLAEAPSVLLAQLTVPS